MSWFNRKDRRRAREGRDAARRRLRPTLLALEGRELLSTFTVTNTLDDSTGSIVGSLRWAVTRSNARSGADTIDFDSSAFGSPRQIRLTSGPLALTDRASTTIVGPGAGLLSVNGNGASRVLTVSGGASISGLTITGGLADFGGGLANDGGTLAVTDAIVSGNTARGNGGGVYSRNGGTTTLTNVTVSGNAAGPGGGGVSNHAGATTTLTNATVSGNSAGTGGGLYNYGANIRLVNCTVSGNSSSGAGGLFTYIGTVTLTNTIIAAQARGGDVIGVLDSSSSNSLIGNGSGMVGISDGSRGNLVGSSSAPINPRLGPLGDDGGPTLTMPLLAGSPAIDAGTSSGAPGTDERGFGRVGAVDMGAFESQGTDRNLVVTTTTGGAGSAAGKLSLRQAVNLANAFSTADTITFDPVVFGSPRQIVLTTGQLALTDGATTTITGPASDLLSISGGGSSRVFLVNAGASGAISGLTIIGGSADRGAGLYNAGTASLTDCIISGNSASQGAGLDNRSTGTLTLVNCTVTGNTISSSTDSSSAGAGLYNAGRAALSSSTISFNAGGLGGGGIANSGGSLTLTDCTVTGNSARRGGGVASLGTSTTSLTGCTVVNNTSLYGGGLVNYPEGTLLMTDCTVSGNSAGSFGDERLRYGGGLVNSGSASLSNVTLIGNTSGGNGGGIENKKSGILTLVGCTVGANSVGGIGGGLDNLGAATLINSTIAGNVAGTSGGGIENRDTGSLALIACTVSGNSAPGDGDGSGGGLQNTGGRDSGDGSYSLAATRLSDTIIAGNLGGNLADLNGAVLGTHNLIGSIVGQPRLVDGVDGNLVGMPDHPINPLLAVLGDYGGPTQTMPPLPGSPAIDAGMAGSGFPESDQRGMGRVGARDIGAFESQGFVLSPAAGSTPQKAIRGTTFANPLALVVTGRNPVEPVDGGVVRFTPPPSSGATATLSASLAVISGGRASVTATASPIPGSFTVTASIAEGSNATFDLTNTPQVTQLAVGFGGQSFVVSPEIQRALPWAKIQTIRLTFDGDASGLTLADFTLNGIRFGDYLAGASLHYDAATQTATLTLAPASVIGSDGWFARVDKKGDRLTFDFLGTRRMFNVLPGDRDGNGVVNLVDINAVRKAARRGSAYDMFADLNGDGVVDAADVALLRKFSGSRLT